MSEAYTTQQLAIIDGASVWTCTECSSLTMPWMPDVFLEKGGGMRSNPHLADEKTGTPIPYSSKREKAAIMRMLNVHEGGDARHGDKNKGFSKTRKSFIV